jgi:predicted alpha/beta-fold hydrolase
VTSVRAFDEAFTAPHFGFRNADDYYHRASAMRIIDRIALPALVITAEDDPFVPSRAFRDPRLSANPWIDLRLCEHGGHCGFVGPAASGDDGYWAENEIIAFVEGRLDGVAPGSAPPARAEDRAERAPEYGAAHA